MDCVGVKAPLPETWYCPNCVVALGLSSSSGTDKAQKEKKRNRK
jgi:chromatin modification-related protein YNG2